MSIINLSELRNPGYFSKQDPYVSVEHKNIIFKTEPAKVENTEYNWDHKPFIFEVDVLDDIKFTVHDKYLFGYDYLGFYTCTVDDIINRKKEDDHEVKLNLVYHKKEMN